MCYWWQGPRATYEWYGRRLAPLSWRTTSMTSWLLFAVFTLAQWANRCQYVLLGNGFYGLRG